MCDAKHTSFLPARTGSPPSGGSLPSGILTELGAADWVSLGRPRRTGYLRFSTHDSRHRVDCSVRNSGIESTSSLNEYPDVRPVLTTVTKRALSESDGQPALRLNLPPKLRPRRHPKPAATSSDRVAAFRRQPLAAAVRCPATRCKPSTIPRLELRTAFPWHEEQVRPVRQSRRRHRS